MASFPTNSPTTCTQHGSYTYNAADKAYTFIAAPPNSSDPGYIACTTWGTAFQSARVKSSRLSADNLFLIGTYFNNNFTVPSNANYCFARVPVGKYCGSALSVPANLVTADPFNFQLNIEDPISPCTIGGYYLLSAAYGDIIYEVGSVNCSQYLVFNNITYAANPSAVSFGGSAFGVPFEAKLRQAQC